MVHSNAPSEDSNLLTSIKLRSVGRFSDSTLGKEFDVPGSFFVCLLLFEKTVQFDNALTWSPFYGKIAKKDQTKQLLDKEK